MPATVADSRIWTAKASDALANAAIYKAIILGDAPIAYWRCGETSGAMLDQMPGNHSLTLNGTITRGVTGIVPGDPQQLACSVAQPTGFNYLSSSASAFFGNQAGALSLECWIKLSARPQQATLVRFGQFTDLQYLMAVNSSGGLSYQWYDGAFRAVSTANGLIATGSLYHLIVTRAADGVSIGLNVNGVRTAQTASSTPTIATSTQVLTLLSIQAGSQQTNGVGQDFAIYNYELSPVQVSNHWLGGSVALGALISAASDAPVWKATTKDIAI